MPLLILGLLTAAVAAQPRANADLDVTTVLGLGGWVVPGAVSPLRIEVRAASAFDGTLVVEVPSARRGGEPLRHAHPLRLPPSGRQQVHVDVIVHDPRRPLIVTIRDPRGERVRRTVPVGMGRAVESIVAALSRDAAGLEFLSRGEGKRRPAYLTEADLPVRWQSYEAVELLILRDLDARALAPAQQRALLDWVAQGGRLLVVAPHRLDAVDAGSLQALLPPRSGRYGLGTIEVWSEDLFAPALRSRSDLHARLTALLRQPRRPSVGADAEFASVLPATRPLPGPTQLSLAAVSVLYIFTVRVVLRRLGAVRGAWLLLTALVIVSTGIGYTLASGARSAATSVSQLSIVEMLGTLPRARATTHGSLIAPYGGRFALRLPEGATARTLEDASLTFVDGGREVRGAVAAGQLSFVARQIVPLMLQARLLAPGTLVIERGAVPLRGAVLYRQRQLYRLPADLSSALGLDPARWEPVDRGGVLGPDVAGQAMAILFKQLDRLSTGTWLIGRLVDERFALQVPGGRPGESVRLVVVEVR